MIFWHHFGFFSPHCDKEFRITVIISAVLQYTNMCPFVSQQLKQVYPQGVLYYNKVLKLSLLSEGIQYSLCLVMLLIASHKSLHCFFC